MVDPRVILIAAGIAIAVWLGDETVKGVKWIGHKVQHAAHHVLHPHETEAEK